MVTKTLSDQNAPLYFQTHRSKFIFFLSYLISAPPLFKTVIHSIDHARLKPPVIFLLLPPSTWITGVKHHAQKWTFFRVGGKCCNLQSHCSGLTALLRQSHSVFQAVWELTTKPRLLATLLPQQPKY